MDIGQDARLPGNITREDPGACWRISDGASSPTVTANAPTGIIGSGSLWILGSLKEAGRSYDRFRTMDRDFMSDCEACEQDEIMRYFLLKGDDEKVLVAAQPILKGRMSLCGDSPSDFI